MQNASDSSNEGWQIEPYEALVFAEYNGELVPTRIAHEDSIAANVDSITQFVRRVIDTKHPLLTLSPVERINANRLNTLRVKATQEGECLLRCLGMDLDRVLDKYPDIGKYNRYFGIYLAAVMREVDFPNGKAPFEEIARFDWLRGDDRDFFSDDMLTLFVKYSNDAVEQIRRIGTSKAFGTWVKAIERQSCENEERLQSLFDACLSINRSILVLRFDLGYSQLHCDAELLGNAGVSYDDVRKHREALRRFLKSDLRHRLPPGACKGIVFAIKLEYGLDKGYHFHVVVALNGKIVCKDGAIAEMICDEWRNEITEGRGGACNCNRRRYRRRGIGSIKRKEVEKLDILKKEVLPYITKVDFYGKMVKPEKHRVFWTSHPPAITANPMSGDRSPDGGDIDLE